MEQEEKKKVIWPGIYYASELDLQKKYLRKAKSAHSLNQFGFYRRKNIVGWRNFS